MAAEQFECKYQTFHEFVQTHGIEQNTYTVQKAGKDWKIIFYNGISSEQLSEIATEMAGDRSLLVLYYGKTIEIHPIASKRKRN